MSPFGSATGHPGRRRALWLLLVVIFVVHGWVGEKAASGLAEAGAVAAAVPRMEVAYVRELAPTAPPPLARATPPPAPARRPRPAAAATTAQPASSAQPVASVEAVADAASAPAREAGAASAVDDAAPSRLADSAAASPASSDAGSGPGADPALQASATSPASSTASSPSPAASSALAGFEWPVSTRVTYQLTGNYRGEVSGSANVEWIRVGTHYQVHLDLRVGPSFAPLITRRLTSDGTITQQGLTPLRFDQETRLLGSDRAPVTLRFEPGSVVLANGSRQPSPPGLQDTASQFVQLSYLFGTQPGLLRVGGTVEVPLALPLRVGLWTYDVLAEEPLATPFGELATLHLKPRPQADRPGELSAEVWFAPQLRYLPARLLIRQGSDNFLDLRISRRPELAGS